MSIFNGLPGKTLDPANLARIVRFNDIDRVRFLPGKPSKMDKIEKFLCIMSRKIDWHQRLKFPLFLRIDPQKVSLTPTPNFTQIWPEFWALDLVMVCSRSQSRKPSKLSKAKAKLKPWVGSHYISYYCPLNVVFNLKKPPLFMLS